MSYFSKQGSNMEPSPLLLVPCLEDGSPNDGIVSDHFHTVGSEAKTEQLKPSSSGDKLDDILAEGSDSGGESTLKRLYHQKWEEEIEKSSYLGCDVMTLKPNRKGKITPNFKTRFIKIDKPKVEIKRNMAYKNDGWIRDLTEEGIEPNPGWVTCHNCGEIGHKKSECQNPKVKLCNLCLSQDHLAAKCPFEAHPVCNAQQVQTPAPAVLQEKRKLCSGCGSPKHIKKDCKNSNASVKGGRGVTRQNAVTASVSKSFAEMAGNADGLKEKIKEMKEQINDKKETPEKVEEPRVNQPTEFTFEVHNTEQINKPSLVFFLVMWKFMSFFVALIFVFDQLFWNPFTVHMGKFVGNIYGVLAGVGTWSALFWGQNLIMVVLVYLLTKAIGKFKTNFTYNRRFQLVNSGKFVEIGPDNRPTCMVQKRSLEGNWAGVIESEFYSFEVPLLSLNINYGLNVVDRFKIEAVAFTEFASIAHSAYRPEEVREKVRKEMAKFGKLNWDKTDMTENMLLEKTCYVLDYYHEGVRQLKHNKKTFFDDYAPELADFDDKMPFMLNKWYGKASMLFLILFILYSLGSWYTLLRHDVFDNLWSLGTGGVFMISNLYHNASFVALPCAEAVSPIGVAGYKISDFFASGISDNVIGSNKEFYFNYTDAVSFDRYMAIFTPFAIPGIAMPLSDRNDSLTTAAGLAHRGGGETPIPDKTWLKAKAEIALSICEHYFQPLSGFDMLSVQESLAKTAYTLKRKADISLKHTRGVLFDQYRKVRETAMFNKYEPYQQAKHSRSIQGMHDRLWDADVFGTMGVFVKTMEQYVYDLPACVKHMTPNAQVEKLLSLGPGSKTVSDYSSYEASFSDDVKESAQFVLYDFMVQALPEKELYMSYYRWLLGGKNNIENKFVQAIISNLKCSGDFDTALSNYFDNVVTWCTVFQMKHNVPWYDSINWFLCEGDDNITDDHGFQFEEEDFAKLGMKAKLQTNLTLEEAGFCQKFVSPRTKNLLCDPIRFLGKRQYYDVKYLGSNISTRMSLLRAVAMSTLSMYPNAPVVSEWAWKVYNLTEGYVVKTKHKLDMLKNYTVSSVEVFDSKFTKPVLEMADRVSVSLLFDFCLEKQEEFTRLLEGWNGGLFNLPHWWFPDNWREFYWTYAGSPQGVYDHCAERYDEVVQWLNPHLKPKG